MFSPEHSLTEIVLRDTMMSIVLFSILRFFAERHSEVIGGADLLVIILIADAVQSAMANEHRSITEGTLLGLTIVIGSFAVDRLGSPSARCSRIRGSERPSAHDKGARLSLESRLLGDGGGQAVEPSGDVG